MKYNFPIKYAIMPIYEKDGWYFGGNELEYRYDIKCYIVSKCYLLSNKKKYTSDGGVLYEYEVFFPYHKRINFNTWERQKPNYNFMNNNCINSTIVNEIYETYEEAFAHAQSLNKDLYMRKIANISILDDEDKYLDKIREERAQFTNKLNMYKSLEKQIQESTTDMDNSKVGKLDDIILIEDNNTRLLYKNLYECLNLSYFNNYVVYSISKEQYEYICNIISKGNSVDVPTILASSRTIIYKNNSSNDSILIDNNGKNTHVINEYGGLLPIGGENTCLPVIDKNTVVLLTTENYDDVLTSYKRYDDIEPTDFGFQIKKKTLSKS